MSKIITITANPAVDSLVIAQHRGNHEHLRFPAGKGINVSRTVQTLGGQVLALGFVGAPEREFFDQISSKSLSVDLIPVTGTTRKNTTTFDPGHKVTDHTRTKGFSVPRAAWLQLFQKLDQSINPGDVVIASGSLPPDSEGDEYETVISICKNHGVRSILDSSNGELVRGVIAKPYMIKPNLEELAELIPVAGFKAEADIIDAAVHLWSCGIELVVISRGAAGVVVVYGSEPCCLRASVSLDEPASPTGNVGSGDALVGGIAYSLRQGRPVSDAVRLGVACGAANVLTVGPGICSPLDIERLSARARIEDITDQLSMIRPNIQQRRPTS